MSGLILDTHASQRLSSRSGPRAWLLAYGAAAAGLAAILWLLVSNRGGMPLAVDARAQAWAAGWRGPALTAVAKVLDFLGRYYGIAFVTLVAAFCAWGLRERRVAIGGLVLVAGGAAAVELLAWAIGRPRPDPAGWLVQESGSGFPSAHAASTLALCLLLVVMGRRYLRGGAGRYVRDTLLMLLPLLMGLSQIYLGVHHLSDVIAGWLVGAAWFCFCWWWIRGGDASRHRW